MHSMLRIIEKLYQFNIRITVSFLIVHLISFPISMSLSLLQRDARLKRGFLQLGRLSGVNTGANYVKGKTDSTPALLAQRISILKV